MPDSAEESQRRRGHVKDLHVLKYLREMIEYSRLDRHPEMQREYEQVWVVAAAKIYGPLPDRWRMAVLSESKTKLPALTPEPPPLVEWQRETLEWPARRIIDYYMRRDKSKFLVLDCGHHVWTQRLKSKYGPDETRPCHDCYKAEKKLAKVPKKKPASVPASEGQKAVTA